MKIKTDFAFPEQYRNEAEDYISYKHSLGFSFAYDDQKRLASLLKYLYENSTSNSVTELTKNLVDGYLGQYQDSRSRTIHAKQSLITNSTSFRKMLTKWSRTPFDLMNLLPLLPRWRCRHNQ